MEADPAVGETPGALQAPFVVKQRDSYRLLYSDWNHVCMATGQDGKSFERMLGPNGKTGMFSEGDDGHARDIMALQIGGLWHGYYSAYPSKQNAVYCRTSPDLKSWSESKTVAFGGRAGVGPYDAECPHVVQHNGKYYLFRTQKYGEDARTCVYASDDPLNFGINEDRKYFVCELPIAAPELIHFEGQDYIAALLPTLKGVQIAKLGWKPSSSK
jgi:hypothetical protein